MIFQKLLQNFTIATIDLFSLAKSMAIVYTMGINSEAIAYGKTEKSIKMGGNNTGCDCWHSIDHYCTYAYFS